MNPNPENDADSLVPKVFHDECLKSLMKDYLEMGIDAVMNGGFIRDVPVVSTFANVLGAVTNFQATLLSKKILRFISGLESIPPLEREKQIEKLVDNPAERSDLGENLLMLLDKMNDVSKPEMLAKAFLAFLQERIDRDQFYALAHIIDIIIPPAISEFSSKFEEQPRAPKEALFREHLLGCGLLQITFNEMTSGGNARAVASRETRIPSGNISVSPLGQLFYSVVLE